jgi:hypothetical protein
VSDRRSSGKYSQLLAASPKGHVTWFTLRWIFRHLNSLLPASIRQIGNWVRYGMPGPSLGVKRVESRWIEGFRANRRLLEVERVSDHGILPEETFSADQRWDRAPASARPDSALRIRVAPPGWNSNEQIGRSN